MTRLVVGLLAGALTAMVLAGCSNGPSLKQGDCAVIGSDGSIHQVSCQQPPQPEIYYVAQVTTGSCTVTADNEVTQNGETLCLRQIYRGSNTSNISAPPPSTAPTQPPLPVGAKYLGPITQKEMYAWDCFAVATGNQPRHRKYSCAEPRRRS